MNDDYGQGVGWLGPAVLIVAALVVIAIIGGCQGLERTGPQEVKVIQNGGWFDDSTIRQVIPPESGQTWTGWWSSTHTYPSGNTARFYRINQDGNRSDSGKPDNFIIPTGDGIRTRLEVTIKFNFVGETDEDLLKLFDRRYGNRPYRNPRTGAIMRTYEGDSGEGFAAFLDTEVRPVINSTFKETWARYSCAEVSPDCALATANAGDFTKLDKSAGQEAEKNLTQIEESIAEALNTELAVSLGRGDGPRKYLRNFAVNIETVQLPSALNRSVERVQQARTDVTRAEARVQEAKQIDERNRILATTYDKSPILGQIDAIKAAREGKNPAQVIVTVGSGGPGLNVNTGR